MGYDLFTHACGHEGVYRYGSGPSTLNKRQQARKIAQMAQTPCDACRRAEKLEAARRHAAENGLADLTGTEEQIAWATVIRHEMLIAMPEALAEFRYKVEVWRTSPATSIDPEPISTLLDELEHALRTTTDAAWWIESNAGSSMREFFSGRLIEHFDRQEKAAEMALKGDA